MTKTALAQRWQDTNEHPLECTYQGAPPELRRWLRTRASLVHALHSQSSLS